MLKRLANRQGDAKARVEACLTLTRAYAMGDGVAKDEVQMIEWLTKAAGLNHAEAPESCTGAVRPRSLLRSRRGSCAEP